ncbi:MAG: RNA polymerase sigma factor [Lachnospiraceae bacterium]|nr:RNA polymerase sigma factor [Lachnospiraceae bacterium]
MENINTKDNFIRLVEQYQNLVFSVCLKMTGDYFAAEDLAQETFISAYKHLEEFDGKSEKAWICRIAGNKCIDYHRAAARRMVPMAEEDMPEKLLQDSETPLHTVMTGQVMDELRQCCEDLQEPYRTAALMHFLEGQTAGEIADRTGVGINTVQTRIYRAREKLKQSYRKEMLED